MSTDGADTIGYRVTSGAGITSTTGTCVLKLATKTPSLSVKPHKVNVEKKAGAKLTFSYTWAGSRGIPASLDVMVTTYGHQKVLSTITPVAGGGTQTVTLPWNLPAGHYTLHLRLTDAAGQIVHATAAIVAKR